MAAAPAFIGARRAYERGDYTTALSRLEPLAEQGDARALNLLGDMHNSGEGVRQSLADAVRLYARAARAGHSGAQYNLGVMIADGAGVAQDDVTSLMWLTLAKAGGHSQAADEVDIMTSTMPPEQIESAREMVRRIVMLSRNRTWRRGRISAALGLNRRFGRLSGRAF